jgi:hypothetical protein
MRKMSKSNSALGRFTALPFYHEVSSMNGQIEHHPEHHPEHHGRRVAGSRSDPPSLAYIDSSMLAELAYCPRSFYHRYILHLHPATTSLHLNAGAAFAKALETVRLSLYAGGGMSVALSLGEESILSHPDLPMQGEKSKEVLCEALTSYWHRFPFDQVAIINGAPATEFSFAVPLVMLTEKTTNFSQAADNSLLLVGRFDAILEDDNHRLWILDDKTCSQLGATWAQQWQTRAQFLCYAWAVREFLKAKDHPAPWGLKVRGICLSKTGNPNRNPARFEEYVQPILWSLVDKWEKDYLEPLLSDLHRWTAAQDRVASRPGDPPSGASFPRHGFSVGCINYHSPCPYTPICTSNQERVWYRSYDRKRWDPVTGTMHDVEPLEEETL